MNRICNHIPSSPAKHASKRALTRTLILTAPIGLSPEKQRLRKEWDALKKINPIREVRFTLKKAATERFEVNLAESNPNSNPVCFLVISSDQHRRYEHNYESSNGTGRSFCLLLVELLFQRTERT